MINKSNFKFVTNIIDEPRSQVLYTFNLKLTLWHINQIYTLNPFYKIHSFINYNFFEIQICERLMEPQPIFIIS